MVTITTNQKAKKTPSSKFTTMRVTQVKTPEEKRRDIINGRKRFFIIWQPDCLAPPKVVFTTVEQADAVARKMAEQQGVDFFVLQSVHRVKVKKSTVKTGFR